MARAACLSGMLLLVVGAAPVDANCSSIERSSCRKDYPKLVLRGISSLNAVSKLIDDSSQAVQTGCG